MSFVGKLLVVLQVVLSICFMTFAGAVYATHKNWKQKHDTVNTQLQQTKTGLNSAITKLGDSENKHKIDMDALRKEADSLTADVQKLESDNTMLLARQESLELNSNVAQEQAKNALSESAARNTESSELRKQNQTITASRDVELRGRLKLEDDLREANGKVATLNSSLKKQLRDIALYQKKLRQLGVTADTTTLAARQQPPQAVDGKVKRVTKSSRGTVKLLEITIGSDDGLVEGHELIVYRGDKYLGKIRIVETSTDKAVAEVVSAAKTGLIKEGDIVATKL